MRKDTKILKSYTRLLNRMAAKLATFIGLAKLSYGRKAALSTAFESGASGAYSAGASLRKTTSESSEIDHLKLANPRL